MASGYLSLPFLSLNPGSPKEHNELQSMGNSQTRSEVASGVPQGTRLRLFADDVLLYAITESQKDSDKLQHDLNALETWAGTWGMIFNPSKCHLLRVNRKQHLYLTRTMFFATKSLTQ